MKLDTHRDARNFLAKLDAKQFRQIVRKMFTLTENPLPPDSETLKGYADMRRADVGEFRIIYRIEEDVVEVVLIGRRNDDAVYRALERRR